MYRLVYIVIIQNLDDVFMMELSFSCLLTSFRYYLVYDDGDDMYSYISSYSSKSDADLHGRQQTPYIPSLLCLMVALDNPSNDIAMH